MTSSNAGSTAAKHVLVVEDDHDTAEAMCIVLQMYKHSCRAAHYGRLALALAAEALPDVALVDLGLPDMTGFAVARALRALPGGDEIYMVAVTGFCGPDERRLSIEAGFDEFLVKPVEAETLEKLVARAARRPR